MEKLKKLDYSKNERFLRLLCFAIIVLCEIIGILLFILSKPLLGTIVLISCAVSSFLISSFFIGKIKKWFGNLPKKRIVYAAVYILLILICMITTLVSANLVANNYDEFRNDAISYVQEQIKTVYPVSEITEIDVVEAFEFSDSYYFEIEASYTVVGVGGAVTRDYSFIYLKINRYTGRITELDYKQYMNTKTFLK